VAALHIATQTAQTPGFLEKVLDQVSLQSLDARLDHLGRDLDLGFGRASLAERDAGGEG
jgi:hypothetical protein